MSLLDKVINELKEFCEDDMYVFKKCQSPDSIVVLQKLASTVTTENENTNVLLQRKKSTSDVCKEESKNEIFSNKTTIKAKKEEHSEIFIEKIIPRVIIDEEYAQYRANELLVVKIISLPDLKDLECARSIRQSYFQYCKGEIVKSPDFEPNQDIVSAAGIHYFKSVVAALCFGFSVPGVVYDYYSGVWYDFNYNGKLLAIYHLKDGKLHGKQRVFLDDGTTLEYQKS